MLEVGYLLPSRDRIVAGLNDPLPLVTLAERAESLGFDSVWAGDSPVARPRADALAVLAAVAVRTSRVTIGTAVLLAALRSPVLLAQQLATVDALSAGRLVVGVGSGFPYPATEAQFRAVGADYGRRLLALEERVAAMRALWNADGRAVSFAGETAAFTDLSIEPRPARPGGPPIWMAGAGGAAMRRVGRLADGWLPYPPAPERYAADLARLRTAAERAGRRHPVPALYATVALERDGVPAGDRLRRSVERYYDVPLKALTGIQAMFAGDGPAIARWLDAYIRAGVRHIVLRVADDDQESALEVLAERVLPAVRERQDVAI